MVNTIKFSEMTPGGDLANGEKTPGLLGGANVLFNNPWTFLAPGTTGDRPVPDPVMYYRLRLNTTLQIYEFYDPTSVTWVELSGSGTGTVNPGTVNDIAYYAASGQAVSALATANNAILVTSAGGVPSLSTTTPAGLSIPSATITASTAALTAGSVIAAPVAGIDLVNKTYADSLFGSGVASATGTTNQVLVNSTTGSPQTGPITLTLPQDIATGSTPTFGGLTLTTTPLNGASGGTGINNSGKTITLGGNIVTDGLFFLNGAFPAQFNLTASTTVTFPVSGTLVALDSNNNLSANNFLEATTFIITSGGTTVLTVASAGQQLFTGTSAQNVTMPVVATLVGGQAYRLINDSTNAIFVSSSGANSIVTMQPLTQALLTFNNVAGTSATSWDVQYTSNTIGVESITGTAGQVIASSPTGNITLSLPQSIATTSSPTFAALTLTAPLSVANGGTGDQLFTSYGVICGGTTAVGALQSIASVGTSGQVFVSNGPGVLPSFQTIGTGSGTVASGTINQLSWYASSGTTVSGLATAASGVLVTSAGSVPSISTTLPNGLAMGTPASITLTNATGLPIAGITGLGTGVATALAAAVNGTGSISLTTNATFVTPVLGVASGTSLTLSNPHIAGAGGLVSFQIFTSGTAATYTKPAGITSILVEVIGGGGGGGGGAGGASAAAVGGGGGSGGYARLWVPSAAGTYTYTVGAAGAGGTAGFNAGSTGGTTTFSASSLQASGGSGGAGMPSTLTSAFNAAAGGVAGIGTNGNINAGGEPGAFSVILMGAGANGNGGSGFYGGGGVQPTVQSTGNAGSGYGSGGSGAVAVAASQAGGPGSAGVIIVWEFC